jgi:hypothetical protein
MIPTLEAILLRQARAGRPGSRQVIDVRTIPWSTTLTSTAGVGSVALEAPDRDFVRVWVGLNVRPITAGEIIQLYRMEEVSGAVFHQIARHVVPAALAGTATDIPVIGGQIQFAGLADWSTIRGVPELVTHYRDVHQLLVSVGGAGTVNRAVTGLYIDVPL